MKIFFFSILMLFGFFSYASDDDKSLDELVNAAEKGDSNAQHAIGLRYYLGLDVVRSGKLAADWYRKAVMQGNKRSLHNLGLLYCDRKSGIEFNIEAGYALLILAATENASVLDGAVVSSSTSIEELAKEKMEYVSSKMTDDQITAAEILADEMSKSDNILAVLDAYLEKAKKEAEKAESN